MSQQFSPLLDERLVESILRDIPQRCIGVVGDLYLDRYFDLDGSLTEPSLETGLDAYQVVQVRSLPGAAGTIINNLAALGVGTILPVSLIGDDGEGYELRQALRQLPSVNLDGVESCIGLRTPTYLKPMLAEPGQIPRELNRLDIHNRHQLTSAAEERLLTLLEQAWSRVDALVVLDQVSLPDCGVITQLIRERLSTLARQRPGIPILADSRERIGLFRNVSIKPNQRELLQELPGLPVEEAILAMVKRTGKDVYCTRGERGILFASPEGKLIEVPGYSVSGPVDPVGAGDSTSAGILSALAAGATPTQAASFGNLVASITVQQLGTTGTATPEQVRERWREIRRTSSFG